MSKGFLSLFLSFCFSPSFSPASHARLSFRLYFSVSSSISSPFFSFSPPPPTLRLSLLQLCEARGALARPRDSFFYFLSFRSRPTALLSDPLLPQPRSLSPSPVLLLLLLLLLPLPSSSPAAAPPSSGPIILDDDAPTLYVIERERARSAPTLSLCIPARRIPADAGSGARANANANPPFRSRRMLFPDSGATRRERRAERGCLPMSTSASYGAAPSHRNNEGEREPARESISTETATAPSVNDPVVERTGGPLENATWDIISPRSGIPGSTRGPLYLSPVVEGGCRDRWSATCLSAYSEAPFADVRTRARAHAHH